MFALRRIALRVASSQPSRQSLPAHPPSRVITSRLQKPALVRTFHQSWTRLADEVEKKPAEEAGASPAEAESASETVSTEPSAAEQAANIKEESVATPEVADAANESVPASDQRRETTSQASTVAETAQSIASGAAQSARRAAAGVADTARSFARNTRPRAEPSKILYVGNLFFEVTAPQLEAEFARCGEISNCRVVADSRGLSKGFGYVEYATQSSADRAVIELDQTVFQGRRMAVQYHVRREPRDLGNRQRREPSEPSKTLFIGNMSYQMSDRDLNDLFREIRNVIDVRVAIDRRSGQPRGFAHADFIDTESAQRAKAYLEKKVVYGRALRVDYSQSSSSSRPESTG